VQWDDSGIRSHHWLRKDVPWDITAGQPNPSASWGTPDNFVDAGNCNIRDHFKNHMMVIVSPSPRPRLDSSLMD
jgi:hypothetical protein